MKARKYSLYLPALLLLMPLFAGAATLIESNDIDEGPQKMWIENGKIRVTTGQGSQYVLIDYNKKKLFIVDPAKREVVDASEMMTDAAPHSAGLSVKVSHLGSGPKIAGYDTQKYQFSVNGNICEQTLVSRKALKDARIGSMLDILGKVSMNPAGSQFMSDCDRAEGLFAKHYKKLGMPLASIENNGRMNNQVKRIVPNAKSPTGGFSLPTGYQKISLQQMMQDANQGMMPGGRPPAGMPNQAEEPMPPEMQRKMEELMRQFGD